MSHLLKRTKRSCAKLIRKIAYTKQLAQKLQEDDEEQAAGGKYESNNNIALSNSQISAKFKSNENAVNAQSCESLQSILNTSAHSLEHDIPKYQSNNNLCDKPSNFLSNIDINDNISYQNSNNNFQESDNGRRNNNQANEFDYLTATIPAAINCVIFEKVNYKENVKYFQHTPSNNSIDDFAFIEDYQQHFAAQHQAFNRCELLFDKCDINGNSLNARQYGNDGHWRTTNQHNPYYNCDSDYGEDDDVESIVSKRSSLLSSCTTLETWLEDEELLAINAKQPFHNQYCTVNRGILAL